MHVKIVRLEKGEKGVRGVLLVDSDLECVTLERPDLNNQIDISCIPEGVYSCKQVTSPKYGVTFEVEDVPGRTHILFHAGNSMKDSKGCILLGENFNNSTVYIHRSKSAVKAFLSGFGHISHFALEIVDVL